MLRHTSRHCDSKSSGTRPPASTGICPLMNNMPAPAGTPSTEYGSLTSLRLGRLPGRREAAIHVLESEGVEDVFGIPGAAILPFYEARGLVSRVDGMAPIDQVSRDIERILAPY